MCIYKNIFAFVFAVIITALMSSLWQTDMTTGQKFGTGILLGSEALKKDETREE